MLISVGLLLRIASPANVLHFHHMYELQRYISHLTRQWITNTFGLNVTLGQVKMLGTMSIVSLFIAGQVGLLDARVRVEEKALREEFGEEYARYCRTTWKFVPGW
jgi:protein-S-isoprenylcysteine O-methyltransferase Ste14